VAIQTLRFYEKEREVALLHERSDLARRIQDDVIQIIYGAGLLLQGVDMDNPEAIVWRVAEVQQRLDMAITHLREHLMTR